MIPIFFFLAFFQPAQRSAILRDGCSADDTQIAAVEASDLVQVRDAIAGGEQDCYHVDVTRGGKTISGYLLGESLPAIAAFVAERQRNSSETLEAMALEAEREAARAAARAAVKPRTSASTKAAPPAEAAVFENFAGRDLRGKVVSLNGLPGRVIVVQFWARRGSSRQELLSLMPLYNQFRGRGLSVIGLGVGIDSKHLGEALDDVTLPFPQIADPGLAKRYKVDMRVGKTFVLDAQHHVIASGSAADAIREVKRLLARPI